jgi:hypothetical protein
LISANTLPLTAVHLFFSSILSSFSLSL